jgi:UDP-2,3-diacylglucosamine hydrolase
MTRKKSYFVSDLHLFSRRSRAERHSQAIQDAASKAHTFVLGGDIFDFRWTTLPTINETIDSAVRWLDELSGAHPDCDFHFVLGNHDSNERFVARLAELAEGTPNLAWHDYFLRKGSGIFLHGDVSDRHTTPEMLARARQRCLVDKKHGAAANMLYDWAVRARLHKLAMHVTKPKKTVARRLLSYLRHVGHGPESGLKNVYFGHTHAALSNYHYGGVAFHNSGAPIDGLDFQILETDI